ncbi:MAG: hypothetical protein C0501_05685 [Isosphaera sp.]|nr:hypothetical protein [Isosphaera sp.]
MTDPTLPDPAPVDPTATPAPTPTPAPADPPPAGPGRARRVGAAAGRGLSAAGRGLARLRPSQPTLLLLLLAVVAVSAVLTVRKYFLVHVPSGQMLVVVSKFGGPLADGQILAGPGQKGVREQVLGEGWHLVWPVLYETELKPNIVVPGRRGAEPPKVGIVKALGGTPLPAGQFLADRGQQGIWREVLLPGAYRLNPYGYEVKLADMVEVKAGHVGVLRRKLGADGPTEFAAKDTEKGIVRDRVLQPGLYPVNTEEYEVIPCPVGIYQTTYHYDRDPAKNTALVFDASDSNRIQLDCTIEWELKPEFWPGWVAKFRELARIESAVIMLNVKNISRNKGQDYGAEDFLDGVKRERFQAEFTKGLREACGADQVVVSHAFIRNIIIPDAFLKPKRDEQLAREKAVTQKEQKLTAETQNAVVAAQQTIGLEVAKVEARTAQLVAAVGREADNVKLLTDAEVEKLQNEYAAKVAILDAQRTELLGRAAADAARAVNTAKSGLHKMQMDVFAGDPHAFLRYTLSQSLSKDLRLRLFQSGPGTFWTNLGDKSVNLFAPLPGAAR